jgi:hypothetical protein
MKKSLFNPKALDISAVLVVPIFEVKSFFKISVFPPSNTIASGLLNPLYIALYSLY